ncbi:uncharacterized protein A4U43_C07F18000 [Asparagus officinalis]|uniref:DNA repair protein UVH3 n=1 Tax=Asparagus officinalis TaxID=4686 RepID=A0A5P1ECY1_ASPOF|nr:DNA repair protein UVH3 [Asparagus officinalis]ONK63702.1 uncharacterized protein A4U43_C07F18000 [Asparagus officinalis]
MGVQGLWELLAPVGRRVSVETLAGKKLAIDASIWMVQFMKAMRDERGEMLRNAHVLGFFRRICKLLFLRTKPVFVFDGGTPALKRRTIASRRRHRENAQAKIRKTAEKLLLNHLKAKRLEELAQEMRKTKDEKSDAKGKQVVTDENQGDNQEPDKKSIKALTQEALDEMLAASLAAEEEEVFNAKKTTSAGNVQQEGEEEEDEDEEMIFPVTSGKVDPSVLASLPPSMQLDLLVQMRENQMAENRQKYQKIKKTPSKFSELQIQSYLRTVAFRREIDEVQKSAAGRGLGGVQSSRIASEANREFIFSSSFTGDKQMLSAKSVEKNGDMVNQSTKKTINLDSVKHSLFASQSQTKSPADKVTSDFGDDVETYCDGSGRMRVSRVRGLGIHMTRDLQRNLDLMKESEQDYSRGGMRTDLQSECIKEASSAKGNCETNSCYNASVSIEGNSETTIRETGTLTQEDNHCSDDLSALGRKPLIEISFSEDDDGMKDADDNLFLQLVSGNSPSQLCASIHSDSSENESESECIWEEGTVGEKKEGLQNDQNKEDRSSLAEDKSCEKCEMEWEEGDCDVPKDVSNCYAGQEKAVSRGFLEEEADIQEAIRRSLQDTDILRSSSKSSVNADLETNGHQTSVASPGNFTFEENRKSTQLPLENHPERSPITDTAPSGSQGLEYPCQENLQHNVVINFNKKTAAPGKTTEEVVSLKLQDSKETISHTDQNEGIEDHVNHAEHSTRTSEQSGVAPPSLRIPGEDGNGSGIDFKPTVNAQDADPADALAQISESSQSMGRKGEITYSRNDSFMEKNVLNIDTMEGEEMGNYMSSTPYEDLDNHNVASEATLDEEICLLRQERLILGEEQRKLERNAESVSSEMFAECQDLLQMFGLPYIIAPMEAEAQCAYMEISNLVDGVVTDDSDVFLFGARNVYKNIFDDRKYVETYFMKDIETELGLTRETLIRMALLLGSDYTEGVSGIGIVNAIEVVRAFPEKDGLQKFRDWIESPDPSILGKFNSHTGSNSKKKSSTSGDKGGEMKDTANTSSFEENVSREYVDQTSVDDIKEIFMTKHRNVSKNWHLPSTFPSESVITAYISPQIDDSTEPFMWGKPDLSLLRKLCWEKFGWHNKKADELLVPVLKEYNKHETQLRLEAFYTFNERFAKIRSQRIKKAVKGITGKSSVDLMDDLVQPSSSGKKRGGPAALEDDKSKNRSEVKDNSKGKASKKPRRQKNEGKSMQSENGGGDMLPPEGSQATNISGVASNLRGKRGRGRGRARGRGREKEELNDDSTEVSSSDCDDRGEIEKHIQEPEAMSELRRSKRRRKHVEYAEEEMHVGVDVDGSNDAAEKQEPVEQGNNIRTADGSDQKEGDNHSPDVGLSGDYLQSGGGFCVDESETQGNTLDCQTGHPNMLTGNSHSGDCLLAGGGFCTDENEVQVDTTTHLDAGSAKADKEPCGLTNKEPTGGNSRAIKHGDSSCSEGAEDEGEINVGLRAMPSLRKKRRKV